MMKRWAWVGVWLMPLAAVAQTQAPATNNGTAPPPISTVPSDGVVRPVPDATADTAVRPPNVDPKIAVAPPGTPGGTPPGSTTTVIPK